MALCCKLAFWTGKDREQIDRLFRQSKLFRPKWDERHLANGATYGEETIGKAADLVEESYNPATAEPIFESEGRYYRAKGGCFSSRIICGECGNFYGRKIWHSTDKYRTMVWRCQRKYDNDEPCKTPHVTEEQIKAAFVDVMNRTITDKERVLSDIRMLVETLTDTKSLEAQATALVNETETVASFLRGLIEENARTAIDPAEYERRYSELLVRYEAVRKREAELGEQLAERKARKRELDAFYRVIQKAGAVLEFNEGLWNAMVEGVTVYPKGRMVFKMRDGTVVEKSRSAGIVMSR